MTGVLRRDIGSCPRNQRNCNCDRNGDRTRDSEFKMILKLKLLRGPFPTLPPCAPGVGVGRGACRVCVGGCMGWVLGGGTGVVFVMFCVLVLCCSLDCLLVVWGCHLGSFSAPKIHQNATYEVLFFVDIALVLPLLLCSGESYGGPVSVLFSHRLLYRFLVNSGIDLGVMLEGFGGPSRSCWASISA